MSDQLRDQIVEIVEIVEAAHPQFVTPRYVQDRLPGRPSLTGITMHHMAVGMDRIQVNTTRITPMDEKTYMMIPSG